MSAPVLEIEGLHVLLRGERREPDRLMLRGVDLSIRPGEVHALVGESGLNVDGQILVTRGQFGYVVTDVNAELPAALLAALRELPETVRLTTAG